MGGIGLTLLLIAIGYFFGRANEHAHFSRLKQGEAEFSHISATNLKTVPDDLTPGGVLVTGNVVIAVDYFKVIISTLKTLFGGKLRAYESLMERARREALLRLKQKADALGADAVYNVRYEFSAIGTQPQRMGGVELLAYGTAVKHADKT